MAVQAQQQPANSSLFLPADLQPFLFPHRQTLHRGAAIFSGEQGSELTCNFSAVRKRSREELSLLHHYKKYQPSIASQENNSRLIDSSLSSTSGRSLSSPSISSQDFLSDLYQQNLEVDALIRLESERLRAALEEARKRHYRALVMAMEEAVTRKLREKEAELEKAAQKNRELEERIWQMTAENQMWFSLAKNNEALVSSLRSSLEQAMMKPDGRAAPEEGFGDSDCLAAEDAQSGCDAAERGGAPGTRVCRVCGERDVAVLLLPCRHLCLCKDCEAGLDYCPLCSAAKSTTLQIFMA